MALSVCELTLRGCSLVTAPALPPPPARPSCWPGRLVARVVFNDALRARQAAYAAGERVSDTQVQRRVVTLAKTTPQRQWLGEVASVALVQACQDARRCVPELVRLPVRCAQRPQGWAPTVPVPQGQPGLDPADPQRLRHHHRRGAGGEGRGYSPGVVAGPALPASVTGIREADGAGLRIVCGRGGRHTTPPEHQRCRNRPWPHEPRRLVHW